MTMGRVVRAAGLELSGGASASFTLREVPPEVAAAAVGASSEVLEAGLVLSSPGCAPFSLWSRFQAGRGAEDEAIVSFHMSGVALAGSSCGFFLPWLSQAARSQGQPWDRMAPWAALGASGMGHPEAAGREAAAFLSGMVLAAVSDAWAASLVRRACGMVSPDRVVELAREACVEQVMEG
jgi:hypothetical protein